MLKSREPLRRGIPLSLACRSPGPFNGFPFAWFVESALPGAILPVAALPLPEKEQLAAFLSEQLEQTGEQTSQTYTTDIDDDIRQRRTEWIQAHREEYAGNYVALAGDRLVGIGRTIREANEQAKEKGCKNPFLVRLTSEQEILSAGW